MRFSTTFFVSAFAAMASAQNMFTMASIPASIAVGSTFNITWQATTPGTVSLLLVQAASPGSTLVHPVSTIAANITNSGSFAWIPSSLTPKGSGYAIEIIDDSNPYITNYSGQFAIDSTTIASSSAASMSGMTTSASAASSSTGSTSTGSMPTSSGSMTSSTNTASTTMSTVTSSSTSSAASTSSSATATAKIGGAAAETARSGLGLLAALGVAVLFL